VKDLLSQSTLRTRDRPLAILISPNPELRASVIEGLAGCAEVVDCSLPAGNPPADVVLERHPDLCFIDVGGSEDSLALVRLVAAAGIPVAALHVNNDSDLILRSFRCGASEFLYAPIAAVDMLEAFNRLLCKPRMPKAAGQPGRIWTILPAKPGYGATTISCNLALRLRQTAGGPVLLADTDPLLGSISFSLKLKSAFSFIDVMNHGTAIDKDLWRKIVVPYEGIDVLLGPEVPQFETLSLARVPSFLQFVRANYAAVILDSPGPLSEWHLTLARSADQILLVTTNELAAVHSTLRALQLLQSFGADHNRIRLIVNRYEKDNGLDRDAIETALKLDVYWTLPNDYAPVQQSMLEGKVIPASCRLGQSVAKLVEHLTGTPRLPRRNWRSSFAQMFSRKNSKGLGGLCR
jgi:Flp pilus assembly CpaE family ATPase